MVVLLRIASQNESQKPSLVTSMQVLRYGKEWHNFVARPKDYKHMASREGEDDEEDDEEDLKLQA